MLLRTAEIARREFRRVGALEGTAAGVSASISLGHPPKTPRNGEKFAAGSRSGHGFSGVADYLAERMEFELPVFPVGRIGSESEPPNLATEINATSCPLSARNSPSPVRIRLCPSPKTPRKRGSFWDGRG